MGSGRGRVVGDRYDDRQAAGVVDDDLEVLVPDLRPLMVARAVSSERPPAAAIGDAPKLLVILMDERSRMAGDVADRRRRHSVGIAQSAEAAPDRDPVDRRGWSVEERTESVGTVSPTGAGGEDIGLDGRAQSAR